MSTRRYELVYLVSPEASDEQVNALHDQVQSIVSRYNGTIDKTENWGRRKLAYEIYDKLRDRYGALVCETRISETVALATSPMHSKDVFDFAPHSPGAADYRALTQELWDSGFFV